jgi:hypothetical protein
LDDGAAFVQERSQPVVRAVFVHQFADFEGCCSSVDASFNAFSELFE